MGAGQLSIPIHMRTHTHTHNRIHRLAVISGQHAAQMLHPPTQFFGEQRENSARQCKSVEEQT